MEELIKKVVYMKNDGLMLVGTLGAISLAFLPPLIVWLRCKEKLTSEEMSIIVEFLNFEISFFIVCIIATLIPFLWHIGPILCVVNIAYSIMAFIAAKENKPFAAPKFYQFVKIVKVFK